MKCVQITLLKETFRKLAFSNAQYEKRFTFSGRLTDSIHLLKYLK